MISLSPELKPFQDELYKRIGRNLVFYQLIELTLKTLLPCMPIREEKKSRNNGKLEPTLGDLIRSYLERLDIRAEFPVKDTCDLSGLFQAPILKVVDSRNRLAHNFYQTPGVDNFTRAGLEAGLQLLDDDYRDAEAMYDDLVPLFIIYLESFLARTNPPHELAGLYHLVRAYAEQRGLSVVVHDANYADIVALLKEAEVSAPKIDGMTPLSWAGDFIRKAPTFQLEQLGEKKLTEILIATDMFEVLYLPNKFGSGHTVLYRSRPLLGATEYHLFPAD